MSTIQRRARIVALAAILTIATAACASTAEPVDSSPVAAGTAATEPDPNIARITQCDDHPNPFIGGRAFVDVTNSSDATKNYSIEVRFLDPNGVVIDTGSGFAEVLPGQPARVEVLALSSQAAPATCELGNVSSY